ncbi:Replication protein A 70 kDa DNA-binding subunit A [Spatholobus suberectus]|nr:Replication protein A 70 kDa DNA-binding subunit A [Spatholobus suberectus]
MSVNLTPNAIPAIVSGDMNSKPLVQVLDIKLIRSSKRQERYRILLSDAVFSQHAMVATQLNDRVRTGRVKKGSVVQLIDYICSPIQNRKIVVVLNMETIIPDCEIIGNPKPFLESDFPTQGALPNNNMENSSTGNNFHPPTQNTSCNVQNFRPTLQPPYQLPPVYKSHVSSSDE